ncbi:MAG: aminotransferase class V-fold PLP-dependent enzyme, partial [Cyanobacteria bacterium]|nr:aminotransferase class V-fold PLP-dependent enzyme [Cyanobacteriota bacterium]
MEPAQFLHPPKVPPSNEGIYLDYASSTPLDPRVIEAVCETLGNNHGNVYANHHAHGQKAFEAVHTIEAQILKAIGANHPEEDRLIFTASSTESNNLALLGLVKHLIKTGKTHVITSGIEHKSLLGPAKAMAEKGLQVTFLQPDSEGYFSPETIAQALQENTGLVSLQAVNNEVGTIYPLEAIGKILSTRKILFHTDAAQGLGRTPFSIEKYHLDLASISAHKTYGPQGIGGLYVKQSLIPHMTPLFYDGGAGALRPGTMPVALCTGLGLACQLAAYSPDENKRL